MENWNDVKQATPKSEYINHAGKFTIEIMKVNLVQARGGKGRMIFVNFVIRDSDHSQYRPGKPFSDCIRIDEDWGKPNMKSFMVALEGIDRDDATSIAAKDWGKIYDDILQKGYGVGRVLALTTVMKRNKADTMDYAVLQYGPLEDAPPLPPN